MESFHAMKNFVAMYDGKNYNYVTGQTYFAERDIISWLKRKGYPVVDGDASTYTAPTKIVTKRVAKKKKK